MLRAADVVALKLPLIQFMMVDAAELQQTNLSYHISNHGHTTTASSHPLQHQPTDANSLQQLPKTTPNPNPNG